ncbi:MAG: hypothetical protein AAB837_02300 [Patescibacteria group bacterium]
MWNSIWKTFRWIVEKQGIKNGLFFITGVTLTFVYYNFFPKNEVVNPNIKNEASVFMGTQDTEQKDLLDKTCVEDEFSETSWDLKSYTKSDNGFYCTKQSTNFGSPDMWYKNTIPSDFNFIEIRYKAENQDDDNDFLPTFIFSLGDNPRILRFYIAEQDKKVIGFEKNNLATTTDYKDNLERESPARTLSYSMKKNVPVDILIKPFLTNSNSASINFNIRYISSENGETKTEDYLYNFQFPDPSPTNKNSKIKFGIGTVKGGCVKPISYKVCYK